MGVISIVLSVTELIGTAAFAIAGSLTAIDRDLDIFGVVFLGLITATGGGMLRDVLIGCIPPAIFTNPVIFLVAFITSLAVFIWAYSMRGRYASMRDHVNKINNIFDAIGLAAFAVMGTETVMSAGYADNAVLAISLGMITGVGGGMLRDIMSAATPDVFRKHVYAVAALVGSCICYVGQRVGVSSTLRMILGMAAVFIIRMLATRFRWELPKVRIRDEK